MASVPHPPTRDKPARIYRSPHRAARARRTRELILAAAAAQFVAAGYAATTIRSIAQEAGISVPTIERAFGTKAQLLKTAIDVAIAGDDEPVPVLERGWATEAQATATVPDLLAVVGPVLRAAEVRSAGLVAAAFEAASSDPELSDLAVRLRRQRSATAAWIVDRIIERAPLREGLDRAEAIDTVWLLMDPAVFLRLTHDRGWSPARFEKWFSRSVRRLLLSAETLGQDVDEDQV